MKAAVDYRFKMGRDEFVPLVVGGMGVNISTSELALEACRLGGIGHISDAMVLFVCDKKFGTKFTHAKSEKFKSVSHNLDKSSISFDLEDLRQAQLRHVQSTIEKKTGSGGVFVNIMEKLSMADPLSTLNVRLNAALDGGADGITLSAGLHTHSLGFMQEHKRFRDAKIGIIISSLRALKIFLRGAQRVKRLPDYIIVEGPLCGGHLGFGPDWKDFSLQQILGEVVSYLKENEIAIPVVAAGGVFTGSDAVDLFEAGASAVQVATRFTVTNECGLPASVKQKYFAASEKDLVVSSASPTGYLIRMLANSPCFNSNIKPNCEAFGYALDRTHKCQYIEAYKDTPLDESGKKMPVSEKICLCYHFSKYNCYTCGYNAYRLKDTTHKNADGKYQLLSAEHVFNDYLYTKNHEIELPESEGVEDPCSCSCA